MYFEIMTADRKFYGQYLWADVKYLQVEDEVVEALLLDGVV